MKLFSARSKSQRPETDRFFIASVSPIELPASSPVRRTPPRPRERRQPGYMEQFDDTHLFYDVFWDGARVALIGPSLFNLAELVQAADLSVDGIALRSVDTRRGDLVDITFATAPIQPAVLRPAAPAVDPQVNVQPHHFDVFNGRKVLCTISKDNDLIWIRDWVEFHVKAHGADAVLFYDNASSRYRPADVLATIRDIPGIEAGVVVPWPFKFGPGGTPDGKDWDSLQAQPVMLEHARRRFLQMAAAMVNLDIDELVVAEDGASLFDHLAAAASGAITYRGQWIRNKRTGGLFAKRRYRHFRHRSLRDKPYLPKWTVIPARLPDSAQLTIHEVRGHVPDQTPQIVYRHFRAITHNWKYRRTGIEWRHRRRMTVDEVWVRQMKAVGWSR